jgi:hypothetical protein
MSTSSNDFHTVYLHPKNRILQSCVRKVLEADFHKLKILTKWIVKPPKSDDFGGNSGTREHNGLKQKVVVTKSVTTTRSVEPTIS